NATLLHIWKELLNYNRVTEVWFRIVPKNIGIKHFFQLNKRISNHAMGALNLFSWDNTLCFLSTNRFTFNCNMQWSVHNNSNSSIALLFDITYKSFIPINIFHRSVEYDVHSRIYCLLKC